MARRVVLLLACVAVTSARPDAEYGNAENGETSPAKLSGESSAELSEEASELSNSTPPASNGFRLCVRSRRGSHVGIHVGSTHQWGRPYACERAISPVRVVLKTKHEAITFLSS